MDDIKKLIAAAAIAEKNGNRDEFAELLAQILQRLSPEDVASVMQAAFK